VTLYFNSNVTKSLPNYSFGSTWEPLNCDSYRENNIRDNIRLIKILKFLKLNILIFCLRVMQLVLVLILIVVAIFIIVMLMTFVFHVLVFNMRFLVPFTTTENLDKHLIASYLDA
jgi:uncharacterized membrane protein